MFMTCLHAMQKHPQFNRYFFCFLIFFVHFPWNFFQCKKIKQKYWKNLPVLTNNVFKFLDQINSGTDAKENIFPRHIHNNYPDNVGVNKLNINKIALNIRRAGDCIYDHQKRIYYIKIFLFFIYVWQKLKWSLKSLKSH